MKRKLYYLAVLFLLVFVGESVNAQAWEWAKSAGGADEDRGLSIDVDPIGNSFITGYFRGSTVTVGSMTLTNAGGITSSDIIIAKYDALGNAIWAKRAGGTSSDYGNSIAVDANGNSYVTGYFQGSTITFDSITLINTSFLPEIFIVKYDVMGNVLWAKSAGGTSNDFANNIAVDANGNSYITGFFQSSSIVFDNTTLTNAGGTDIFISKYDPSGNVLWAKSAGSSDYDRSIAIGVDANGNPSITGAFDSDSVIFGNITLVNSHYTSYDSDIFMAKYDTSGNVVYAKSAGGADSEQSNSIEIDLNGNTYLIGHSDSPTLTFDSTTLTNASFFIAKYDNAANLLWAKGSVAGVAWGNDLTLDVNANPYGIGNFAGATTFGTISLTNAGYNDIFIVKFDGSGNLVWAINIGSTGFEYGNNMDLDMNGNLLITGSFQSPSINFGSIALPNSASAYSDIFIAKLNVTTGLPAHHEINDGVFMYPNPTTNLLHLTLTKPLPPNTTITITDMQGREVKEVSKITHGGDAIDVSTLTQGVYLLKVNGQVQRFVKM